MSNLHEITNLSNEIAQKSSVLAQKAAEITQSAAQANGGAEVSLFIFGLTSFVLACFVGYYVVWKVTPALHTPLMSVTNAVSGVIVVGAIIALGFAAASFTSKILAFFAVLLASINIFGGFAVTYRMVEMFKKR